MSDVEAAPPGVDPTVPSPARLYDHYLGGKDNYAADREAADRIRAVVPELEAGAWANRRFLQRAVRWLAGEAGVAQFIDIGAGLPTQENTHQVAQAVNPEARVVYADIDPLVLVHAQALLTGTGNTTVITADFRDPDALLGNERLRRTIDFGMPVALLLIALVPFIADEDDPGGLIARYMGALPPGSYLALSHGTFDGRSPEAAETIKAVYAGATASAHFRDRAQVTRLFDGLELVPPREGAEPAVTHLGQWGTDDPALHDAGSLWGYCGVARRPRTFTIGSGDGAEIRAEP
ncbi:SAM-dependent methyltransferase [Thermomonospora umbrina]|uniref:S-adenosyl methyltransferase n=1 Tax=Thermomonospora umbrina TaxID=111806 RepID=A0A3D9SVW6_9ACTN|nr:SAM-dependent methyltransferase [Thermomonospora umbrina]REE99727.1 S-adenosyl methyltransferase [Thermomonospora umbrina]